MKNVQDYIHNITLPYACLEEFALVLCLPLMNMRITEPQLHLAIVLFQSVQLQVILAEPEFGGTNVTAWE
jgi:hypothetical protein